jgi:hypothetical protein
VLSHDPVVPPTQEIENCLSLGVSDQPGQQSKVCLKKLSDEYNFALIKEKRIGRNTASFDKIEGFRMI